MLMKPPTDPDAPTDRPGTAREVLTSFFRLSLTSFGGPIAHLGYFRSEFVERRRWLDDRSCSNLVALCQFLPGPASSQVGMALGLSRAGWWGALAAWIGFTLPSAVALILFAYGIAEYGDLASSGAVQGLEVAVVGVVAQAVWGMGKTLCPDRLRAGLAIFAALLTLVAPSAWGQVVAILVSGFSAGGCSSPRRLRRRRAGSRRMASPAGPASWRWRCSCCCCSACPGGPPRAVPRCEC